MKIHRLNLNLLPYLQVLLKHKSVSGAANELHVTPSVMRRNLKLLREHFQDPLLITDQRSSNQLTDKARLLIPRVHAAIVETKGLFAETSFSPETCNMNFRIVGDQVFNSLVLPKILRKMRTIAPGLTFSIETSGADDKERFSRGEFDIAYGLFDSLENYQSYFSHTTTPALIIHKNHPLAQLQSPITPDDINSCHFVKLQFGLSTYQPLLNYLEKWGAKLNWQYSTDSQETGLALVESADAVLIASSFLIFWLETTLQKNFVALPLPDDAPKRTLELIWPDYWQRHPAHRWTREFICTEIQKMLKAELEWINSQTSY